MTAELSVFSVEFFVENKMPNAFTALSSSLTRTHLSYEKPLFQFLVEIVAFFLCVSVSPFVFRFSLFFFSSSSLNSTWQFQTTCLTQIFTHLERAALSVFIKSQWCNDAIDRFIANCACNLSVIHRTHHITRVQNTGCHATNGKIFKSSATQTDEAKDGKKWVVSAECFFLSLRVNMLCDDELKYTHFARCGRTRVSFEGGERKTWSVWREDRRKKETHRPVTNQIRPVK